LQTWDYSEEGRGYLEWVLKPEAADPEWRAMLREAVLDLMEGDEQLRELRQQKAEADLEVFICRASTRGRRRGTKGRERIDGGAFTAR
jgi:hypothetical protein